MRVEIRSDSVLIEGYVNAVARDSRLSGIERQAKDLWSRLCQEFLSGQSGEMMWICC